MTDERRIKLMQDDNTNLTKEEIDSGWHFCWEFDGLLIGPGMDEMKFCTCLKANENS